MTTVSLPFPPTGNHMFSDIIVRTKQGKTVRRRVKSAKYLAWLETATDIVSMVPKLSRVPGPYALRISAGRPDRRKRDVDNLIKMTSDAIVNGGLVEDDSLCQFVSAEWEPGLEGLRVLVLPTKERT